MTGIEKQIGSIIMASGLSSRYGKNKLLEKLGEREIILHTAGNMILAGLDPLVVTRSVEIKALMDREGISCILHDGEKKSDTMRTGIENLDPDRRGFLFMPADQPLVLPSSLRKMTAQFALCPERAVRLGFKDIAGSPVLFPACCQEALLAYTGERGGAEVLKKKEIPCDLVQASYVWELWDVDRPADMERVKEVYDQYF